MTIASWDTNSPGSNSPAGQGDDEIRAIKTDVKAVFPALTTEIQNGPGGAPPTSTDFTNLFGDVATLKDSSGALPLGIIVMWSGTNAEIPEGFTFCDGNNVNNREVPDLRDRFIWGSGGAFTTTNQTGGSGFTNASGAFSADVTVDDHIITEANLPPHEHTMFVDADVTSGPAVSAGESASVAGAGAGGNNQPYAINPAPNPTTNDPTSGRTGAGAGTQQPLVHSTATVQADGHTHQFTPVFYALAFIMYVGTGI